MYWPLWYIKKKSLISSNYQYGTNMHSVLEKKMEPENGKNIQWYKNVYRNCWHKDRRPNGAFSLRCTTRHGSARLGLHFHCSSVPQYQYRGIIHIAPSSSCWIHSSAINERDVCTSSTDHETAVFWLFKKQSALVQNSCIRSKKVAFDPSLALLI